MDCMFYYGHSQSHYSADVSNMVSFPLTILSLSLRLSSHRSLIWYRRIRLSSILAVYPEKRLLRIFRHLRRLDARILVLHSDLCLRYYEKSLVLIVDILNPAASNDTLVRHFHCTTIWGDSPGRFTSATGIRVW